MNYENYREVKVEEAEYGVILRPGSSNISAHFYKSKEDLEWALANSWFDYKEAIAVKILKKEISINSEV